MQITYRLPSKNLKNQWLDKNVVGSFIANLKETVKISLIFPSSSYYALILVIVTSIHSRMTYFE